MKLILCSLNNQLKAAWERCFREYEKVEFHHGSIVDVKCDAVVSPANSFGFMDGGIDALYLDYFGPKIQLNVRENIKKHHNGEMIVGDADIVRTRNEKIPFLITAPTMRVPMELKNSVNPYLAARAVFILIKDGVFRSGDFKGEKISGHVKSVAMPGLGTGVGKVPHEVCAKQVKEAYKNIFMGRFQNIESFSDAVKNHKSLI